MVYSKAHAGKWVASQDGKVVAVDARLSKVLQKIRGRDPDSVRLSLVPRTPFVAGSHAL